MNPATRKTEGNATTPVLYMGLELSDLEACVRRRGHAPAGEDAWRRGPAGGRGRTTALHCIACMCLLLQRNVLEIPYPLHSTFAASH